MPAAVFVIGAPGLFKERLIYEQSVARTVREQQEKRPCVWSRQLLKIEQLHSDGSSRAEPEELDLDEDDEYEASDALPLRAGDFNAWRAALDPASTMPATPSCRNPAHLTLGLSIFSRTATNAASLYCR